MGGYVAVILIYLVIAGAAALASRDADHYGVPRSWFVAAMLGLAFGPIAYCYTGDYVLFALAAVAMTYFGLTEGVWAFAMLHLLGPFWFPLHAYWLVARREAAAAARAPAVASPAPQAQRPAGRRPRVAWVEGEAFHLDLPLAVLYEEPGRPARPAGGPPWWIWGVLAMELLCLGVAAARRSGDFWFYVFGANVMLMPIFGSFAGAFMLLGLQGFRASFDRASGRWRVEHVQRAMGRAFRGELAEIADVRVADVAVQQGESQGRRLGLELVLHDGRTVPMAWVPGFPRWNTPERETRAALGRIAGRMRAFLDLAGDPEDADAADDEAAG